MSEEFLGDLLEVWAEHGRRALEQTAQERPHELLKIVAGLLPKDICLTDDLPHARGESISDTLRWLQRLLDDGLASPANDDAAA